jgi:hypothetical protein
MPLAVAALLALMALGRLLRVVVERDDNAEPFVGSR